MTALSVCPKCAFQLQTPAEGCPSCGIIFGKIASGPVRTRTMETPLPQSRCQNCGVNARTGHAHLRQNIGMLLARREKHLEGNLCRTCLDKNFWQYTLTTLGIGWLGMISLILAPIYIGLNIYQWRKAISEMNRG